MENFSKEKIVKILQSINGNIYTVYSDWIKICALSIAGVMDSSEEIQNQYNTTVSRYSKKEIEKFAQCFAILQVLFEEKYEDYLGSIYMMLENSSKRSGQFFTPYHISQLLAGLCETKETERVTINEPACGGGANIIAFLEKMKKEGIDITQRYKVVAQDIDWNCVYMCYIQLSLMGVYGIVSQKDALSKENSNNSLKTPMYYMLRGGIG